MTPERVNVLVADDDRDIRDLIRFKLEQAGFRPRVFDDGPSALAAIEADPPDLAVLDVMMPGLSGIDVLRKVRDDQRLSVVRVILLTARSRDADVDAGFATGAEFFVNSVPVALTQSLIFA